jgi:predicted negative regulator of RcsB-dependent stress response
VARITRKELKTDKFALEVEHTVDFFGEHRRDMIRYGAAALAVVLIGVAVYFYRSHQRGVREEALSQALQVVEAPAGQAAANAAGLTFPTPEARDKEAVKRFSEIASKYAGSMEGDVAQYTMASMAADQGRLAEAEKGFKDLAQSGGKLYASLAKVSLADIYFSSGRTAQGEELLRPLIDHPTDLVSRDEAAIALARGIAGTKPVEARKLLDPLRASRTSAVSQSAIQLYSEIPQ